MASISEPVQTERLGTEFLKLLPFLGPGGSGKIASHPVAEGTPGLAPDAV